MLPCYLLLFIPLLPLVLLLLLYFLVKPQRPTSVPIRGRHVLITGGSRGIGLALARRAVVVEGAARVSILARGRAGLHTAVHSLWEMAPPGTDVRAYSADVRDFDAVREALDAAGPVDVLICNHGVFYPMELAEQELEEARRTLDVNLLGTVHLIKAALPGMTTTNVSNTESNLKSITMVSSQAGQVGIYGYAAYSASKFALRGLAEALQQELVGRGVRVSLVFPPDTQTPGFEEELKRRPELTSLIAGSSEAMTADAVAAKTFAGIKAGMFSVPCNFEGHALCVATAGFAPQSSPVAALIEVLCAGVMRLVGLGIQWGWYRSIQLWHREQKAEEVAVPSRRSGLKHGG